MQFAGVSDTTEIEARDDYRRSVENWLRSRQKVAENGAASSFRWQVPIESTFGDGPKWLTSINAVPTIQFVFTVGNNDPTHRDGVKKTTELIYAWERQGDGKLASFYTVYFIEQSFRLRDLGQINRLLSEVEPEFLTEWSMVALLRSSFPARSALPAWTRLLSTVRHTLQTRGQNAEKLLRGLNR